MLSNTTRKINRKIRPVFLDIYVMKGLHYVRVSMET
jgi:hypothetical protein